MNTNVLFPRTFSEPSHRRLRPLQGYGCAVDPSHSIPSVGRVPSLSSARLSSSSERMSAGTRALVYGDDGSSSSSSDSDSDDEGERRETTRRETGTGTRIEGRKLAYVERAFARNGASEAAGDGYEELSLIHI